MGIPADVAKATNQTLARAWSVALDDHPDEPDGILYLSRLNGHTNLAVDGRAVARLRAVRIIKLIAA
ncbi:RES domain-containing protein [Mesorhizobium sp. WSM4307]|uniref:RES domain-containing protein n=1 Tax=unclassified Mesorhizobium TaxID=325217 RepID=UPI00115E4DD8|nr:MULTISPECIES: RES domain-containing protein [unclassified Mesorhizobium]TRC75494.1 RES domain-containing protein [Mesorhizobium sp. WSM4315]TRC86497.1 RES domain-containing protein [Mesorhizobium sp. WSM4307]